MNLSRSVLKKKFPLLCLQHVNLKYLPNYRQSNLHIMFSDILTLVVRQVVYQLALYERSGNQDPNRLALGATPSQGRNQTLLDDLEVTNARVREKPLVDENGYHGALARPGVRDTERLKPSGERGHSLTRNVSTGNVTHTGQSNVTDGVGFEFEISGEVSGRGYRLGKPIQTEGKQGGGVQISFKVKPDGTVYDVRVKPGFLTTVGEVRLKEQAKRYVERIRFNALPKKLPQVDQSGEVFINFTTQLSN